MTAPARTTHHHGDLRRVLVDAALAHVRVNGAATFSLRDATAAAGVTSAAAYRHFDSRARVIDEVVVRGFTALSTFMQQRVHTATSSRDRLVATGLAYVDFARQEPHLFALMFGPDGETGRTESSTEGLGAPSASDQLRAALREHDAEECFYRAWGLAHGLAGLAAAAIVDEDDVRQAISAFVASLDPGS